MEANGSSLMRNNSGMDHYLDEKDSKQKNEGIRSCFVGREYLGDYEVHSIHKSFLKVATLYDQLQLSAKGVETSAQDR